MDGPDDKSCHFIYKKIQFLYKGYFVLLQFTVTVSIIYKINVNKNNCSQQQNIKMYFKSYFGLFSKHVFQYNTVISIKSTKTDAFGTTK